MVNWLKSYLTNHYPDDWLYVLGALFVGVVMIIPDGLVSVPRRLRDLYLGWLTRWGSSKSPEVSVPTKGKVG